MADEGVRFQLFSFLDLLTGYVGVLMFMLLIYSIQLVEIKNPLANILLGKSGSETDVAKAFFLEAREGMAIMLPEGFCSYTEDLRFGGGLDFVLDEKIKLVEDTLTLEEGEVAAVILIRGNAGIIVRNSLRRLLKAKRVDRGVEIIVDDLRTDRAYILLQAKAMGALDKLIELDPREAKYSTYPDLYLLDEHDVPHPLFKGEG
ncbi:MAG: hypothetical protein JXR37_12660 [Kiritimatiellae bacterium]|nr:hypothetical protein [Kiritimatiellia bacterium]